MSLNPNVEQQQHIIAVRILFCNTTRRHLRTHNVRVVQEHSFKQFDKDGSGAIDSSEFKDLLVRL